MQTNIDHLVIGAADLAQGAAYVKETLGVDIPPGGFHPKMGTHNRLMRIGDNVFLEVIAVNPDIDPPASPRWYGLDDPYVRQRIAERPALLTWVVNTSNIENLMKGAEFSFGKPELVSRGDLSWYFGLPDDGRLLAGGFLPYLIDWQVTTHPANGMVDVGCRLRSLEIHHPYASWFESILESIGASGLVRLQNLPRDETPYLTAYIDTPDGLKELQS